MGFGPTQKCAVTLGFEHMVFLYTILVQLLLWIQMFPESLNSVIPNDRAAGVCLSSSKRNR
jgi:hypothetical protein